MVRLRKRKNPKVSFLYFGNAKTSHFEMSSKSFHFFRGFSYIFVLATICGVLFLLRSFSKHWHTESLLKASKKTLLDYEIAYNDLFEKTYDHSFEKAASEEDKIKTFKISSIKSSILTDVKSKINHLKSISHKKLVIKELKAKIIDGQLTLDFSLHSLEKTLQEGHLWVISVVHNTKENTFMMLGLPETIQINGKSLEPLDLSNAHRYNIRNYLNKSFIGNFKLSESQKVVLISILAKNKDNQIVLAYEYPAKQVYYATTK